MSAYVVALERMVKDTRKKTPMTKAHELRDRARVDGTPYHGRVRQRVEYRGEWYDSKREARRAAMLNILLAAGKIAWWVRQVPFEIRLNGERLYRYTADFVVGQIDGTIVVEDAKAAWRDKRGRKRYVNDTWPLVKRMMKLAYHVDVQEV